MFEHFSKKLAYVSANFEFEMKQFSQLIKNYPFFVYLHTISQWTEIVLALKTRLDFN